MYKVLIVDDEKWICELIASSVPWSEMGMQVIATAGNGLEALQILEQNEIDVVITDIRMPGMDGIGLIRAARDIGYSAQFVIVSGFQDFEYAKSALEYNVKSYLVKPVDEDELTVVLYKIIDEMNESSRNENNHAMVQKRLETVSRHMKEQFARMVVKDDNQKHILENVDLIDELGFIHSHNACVVFRIDGNTGNVPEQNIITMLADRLSEQVDRVLFDMEIVYANYAEDQSLVYILNFDGNESVVERLKNHMGDFKQLIGAYRHYSLTVGLGSIVNEIESISDSFRDADTAVKYRLIAGRNQFIDSVSLPFGIQRIQLDETQKRKLLSLVETLDKDGVKGLIDQVFVPEIEGIINPANLIDMSKELWDRFREMLSEAHYEVSKSEQEVYARMESSGSIDMLASYLTDIMVEELTGLEQNRKAEHSRPVIKAKEFITNHYSEPISIGDVAAHVHLNPNYLSKLFKTETGNTFLHYLTQYRIEAAKEMMKDSGKKLADISEAVGYKDTRHFTKIFRKTVGLTPYEFRKLLR